jgi:hypothetical protein
MTLIDVRSVEYQVPLLLTILEEYFLLKHTIRARKIVYLIEEVHILLILPIIAKASLLKKLDDIGREIRTNSLSLFAKDVEL